MNEATGRRKLASIVAIDVAGFSARAAADEADAIDAVAELRRAVSAAAETYGGRVFNSAGDGFMMEFPTVSGAVAAALSLAEGGVPRVRVGVHLGEVSEVAGGDLLGHGVNVAARLESMAPPGGVLISGAVRQALRGPAAKRFKAAGEAALDKMGESLPVYVFAPGGSRPAIRRRRRVALVVSVVGGLAVLAAGAAAWWMTRDRGGVKPLHVSVQTFQPIGGQDSVTTLADSLPESIRGAITGAGVEPLAPGQGGSGRLSPDLVVGGAVSLEDGALHVTTRISDAPRQVTLWSASFDASPAEATVLRDRVAVATAAVLGCAVKAHHGGGETLTTEPLRAFLRACAISDDPKSSEEARALYRQVSEQAPGFAPALAGMARMSALTIRDGPSEDAPSMRREATDYARRAMAIDPDDGDAYQALEMAVTPIDRWEERQSLLAKGLDVDPSNADLAYEQGRVLVALGRVQEALIYQGRAVALDPHSGANSAQLANSLAATGEAMDAQSAIDRAYRLWPDNDQVKAVRFWVAAWTGREADALKMLADPAFANLVSTQEQRAIWSLALQARSTGAPAQIAEARRRLADAEKRGAFPPWNGAQLMAYLGDNDAAFAMIDHVAAEVSQRDPVFLFRAPMVTLQRDPRFMRAAQRYGLVSYWKHTNQWPDFCADPKLPYDCKAEAARILQATPR